jgi:hypothetical protein
VQPNRSAGRRRSGISFEPYELDVMQRPPRAVDPPILNAFGMWRVVLSDWRCSPSLYGRPSG